MVSATARKNLEAHIAGERARDLDAALAPLAEHPRYVIPNFVVEGREALRALYELSLPHLSPENFDEYLRALDDPRVVRWGQDHCVLEYTDDYPLHRGMVVVVHFEGDRVKSENTYFTSASRFGASPMDEKFTTLPGVTPIP